MSEILCFDPEVLTERYKSGALTRGNCRLVITVCFGFAVFLAFTAFFRVVVFFSFVVFFEVAVFFDGVAFLGLVTFFGFFTCLLFPLKNMNLG